VLRKELVFVLDDAETGGAMMAGQTLTLWMYRRWRFDFPAGLYPAVIERLRMIMRLLVAWAAFGAKRLWRSEPKKVRIRNHDYIIILGDRKSVV